MVDWQFLPQNFGQVVGTLKPSIQYTSLPFTPLCSPSLPFAPFCPLHSPLPPLFPFVPLLLAPTEVVGTLKPSIQYALLPFTPLCPLFPLAPPYPLTLATSEVVGTLKPNIQLPLLPLAPFTPFTLLHFPLLLLPPLLAPFTPFPPFCPLHSLRPFALLWSLCL